MKRAPTYALVVMGRPSFAQRINFAIANDRSEENTQIYRSYLLFYIAFYFLHLFAIVAA